MTKYLMTKYPMTKDLMTKDEGRVARVFTSPGTPGEVAVSAAGEGCTSRRMARLPPRSTGLPSPGPERPTSPGVPGEVSRGFTSPGTSSFALASTAAFLVGLVLLAGCEKRVYELELTPDKGQLKRQLTGHIEASGQGQPQLKPLGEDELARIAAAYGTKPPQAGGPKHSFERAFAGRMPEDIGGHGTYHEWTSEFGTARLYIERFRGNDDFVGMLDKCREGIARAIELLLVWVDDTWTGQPEHAAIRGFVDRELRRDLENVVYYLKAAELYGSDGNANADDPVERIQREAGDVAARIPQYLVERQYIELAQLPRLGRVLQGSARNDGERAQLMQLLQEIVRRKIGIAADEPLPPSLALFADQDKLLKSLNDSLRKSPEYRAMLADWEQTPVTERSEVPAEPVSVLSEILAEANGLDFLLGRPDQLAATLHADSKPFGTNGAWDETRHVITWKRRLASEIQSRIAPEIVYAVWSDAAEETQKKLLGSVAVQGPTLFGYCLWRNALTPAEVRQWSKFVNDKQPKETFMQRLEKFRFEGEPEEDDGTLQSSHVRELLLKPAE